MENERVININKCPRCGNVNVSNRRFCIKCGEKIKQEEPTSVPTPTHGKPVAPQSPKTPAPSMSAEKKDTIKVPERIAAEKKGTTVPSATEKTRFPKTEAVRSAPVTKKIVPVEKKDNFAYLLVGGLIILILLVVGVSWGFSFLNNKKLAQNNVKSPNIITSTIPTPSESETIKTPPSPPPTETTPPAPSPTNTVKVVEPPPITKTPTPVKTKEIIPKPTPKVTPKPTKTTVTTHKYTTVRTYPKRVTTYYKPITKKKVAKKTVVKKATTSSQYIPKYKITTKRKYPSYYTKEMILREESK